MDSLGPWEEEQLRRLRIYLQRSGTPIAIVEGSSRGFSARVLSCLYAGLTARTVEVVDLGPSNYRSEMAALWDREPVPGRIVELRGVSGSGTDPSRELLAHLNFNRERFMRPGEAFVFPVDAGAATEFLLGAPDLYRFSQCFTFVAWEDLLQEAERAGDASNLGGEDLITSETLASERVRRLLDAQAGPLPLARAFIEHGLTLRELGRLDAARAAIEAAVGYADRARDDAVRAHARAALSLIHTGSGEAESALRLADEAVALAQAAASVEAEAKGRTAMAGALGYAHRQHEAATQYLVAARLDPFNLPGYLTHAVRCYVPLGMLAKAKALVLEVLSEPSIRQNAGAKAAAHEALGDILIETGPLLEAIAHLGRALAIDRNYSRLLYLPITLGSLATSALWTARLDIARRLTERALESAIEFDLTPVSDGIRSRLRALELLTTGTSVSGLPGNPEPADVERHGLLSLVSRDYIGARSYFETARRQHEIRALRLEVTDCDLNLATCDRLEGHLETARARASVAADFLRSEGARRRLTNAVTELSFIAAAGGHVDEARRHAEEALELIREVGNRFDEPMAVAALARSYEVAGEPTVAVGYHARWRRLVAGMGAMGLQKLIEVNLGIPPGAPEQG